MLVSTFNCYDPCETHVQTLTLTIFIVATNNLVSKIISADLSLD